MDFNWAKLDLVCDLDCEYSDRFRAVVARYQSTPITPFENTDIFGDIVDSEWATTMALTFQSWRDSPNHAPSLIELMTGAMICFEIDGDHPLVPMALCACVLGEIPHHNAYHNNNHFREVMCVIIKLIIMHNASNRNPLMALGKDEILLLLTATAIHDFSHDGHSNIIDGVHVESRLEKRAFKKAELFFDALGMADNHKDMIKQMILATDVSRGDRGRSPAGYVRDMFLAHEHDNVSIVNAPVGYDLLLGSEKLTLMCVLLCEADIAMSSSLDYEFSKEMTKLIASESSVLKANANTLHGFMETICRSGFLSRAGQMTLGQSFQAILLQAGKDKEDNILYA